MLPSNSDILNPVALQQSIVIRDDRTLTGNEVVVGLIIDHTYDVALPATIDCQDRLIHIYATGQATSAEFTVTISVSGDVYIHNGSETKTSIDFTSTTIADHVTLYCDGLRFYELEGSYA